MLDTLIDENLAQRLGAEAAAAEAEPPPALVDELVASLATPEAVAALAADPYWPKWTNPWWGFLLLVEMGLAHRVPPSLVEAMAAAVDGHYVHGFPLREEDLPPGTTEPMRIILCHCALGSVWRMLASCGLNVDERIPWFRPWVTRFGMPDGGFNCDEAAYLRPSPHSSVVSTLPVLEALLDFGNPEGDEAVAAVLDKGAEYLIRRRLCRSLSKNGALMDPSWLTPDFPRFYEYDVLRGLAFLASWAERRRRPLPLAAIEETLQAVRSRLSPDGTLAPRGRDLEADGTLKAAATGPWEWSPKAGLFDLLRHVHRTDQPSPWLTRQWYDTVARLAVLRRDALLLPTTTSESGS